MRSALLRCFYVSTFSMRALPAPSPDRGGLGGSAGNVNEPHGNPNKPIQIVEELTMPPGKNYNGNQHAAGRRLKPGGFHTIYNDGIY